MLLLIDNYDSFTYNLFQYLSELGEDITVARNLPSAEMITGRKVAVLFFDEHSPKEAVIVAVYT